MSRHFSLAELCESDFAERHAIDNTPNTAQEENLLRLLWMLESVREALGHRQVIISSGFRNAAVNRGVGGSRTSAHLDGRAADIKVVGLPPIQVARILKDSRLAFDQLIYEGNWVHLGIPKHGEAPRNETLTAKFKPGGVDYLPGILT